MNLQIFILSMHTRTFWHKIKSLALDSRAPEFSSRVSRLEKFDELE